MQTYNFIVDRLVLKWDKVPDETWNGFQAELQWLSNEILIPELELPWVGKGFNAYRYNQNVGKGDGGMLFSWQSNSEPMRKRGDELFQSARVEFNPAKAEDWQLRVMASWTNWMEESGCPWRLDTVDLAVDVPLPTHSIFVLPLNGAGMTYYQGTRYFGTRGSDGNLKVYDKAAERGIPGPLTRIEYTWRGKCSDPRQFDGAEGFRRRFYVLTYKGCDPVVRGLIYAINDGEISYDELPRRMKTKIKEALLSQQPLEIHFNQSHLIDTLNKYYIR